MTLFLVALLGNVLAWCVHSAAWWLREKCLWLIGLTGYVVGALSVAWLLLLIGLSGMRRDSDPEAVVIYAQEDAFWDRIVLQAAAAWVAVAAIGYYQRKWLKTQSYLGNLRYDERLFEQEVARVRYVKRWQALYSVGAIYSEVVLTAFVYWHLSNRLQWPSAGLVISFDLNSVFFWTFLLPLLILALIRPQVVKVQKWLWQQVNSQRATNE